MGKRYIAHAHRLPIELRQLASAVRTIERSINMSDSAVPEGLESRLWHRPNEYKLRPHLASEWSPHRTAGKLEPAIRARRVEGFVGAQLYVPAAVRKCSIARLQEVAHMYPAFWIGVLVAVALLGVRTRLCLISG